MKVFDIKSRMPSVIEALQELETIIKLTKNQEKVIKIIHGYGSSGKGGAIKNQVRLLLKQKQEQRKILAYIPGEAIGMMLGYDEMIRNYRHLIDMDEDYHQCNDGITYIIYKK